MRTKIRIALYMRLSKEDELVQVESNSIHNQRLLLIRYITREFSEYETQEFVDDGYSGTNFNRPGIQELLEKIKKKEIDCVIVKDYSRLARDYIDAGTYIEHVFPFLGVRFISVNDGYDSEYQADKCGDLDQALKNLVNDLYSKDLSAKVKASFQALKSNGVYCSSHCPFGYRKDVTDRHKVVIVEEEAEVIRRIFQMTKGGYTSTKIAKIFNTENVKTPIEFLVKRGETHRKPIGERFWWTGSRISAILSNEFYAGDIVYDKYEKKHVGGKNHLKPRSEWKIYKNHHEAIIERELFQMVQKHGNSKPFIQNKVNALQGKVVCKNCGKALRYRASKNPYFCCGTRYESQNETCVQKVNVMLLEQIVLFELQKEIKQNSKISETRKKTTDSLQKSYQEQETQKNSLLKKKEEMNQERLALYEKYARKVLTLAEYQSQRIELNSRLSEVENQIAAIETNMRTTAERLGKIDSQSEDAGNDLNLTELSEEIVERFIDKVLVLDEQNVEIRWKFTKAAEEE